MSATRTTGSHSPERSMRIHLELDRGANPLAEFFPVGFGLLRVRGRKLESQRRNSHLLARANFPSEPGKNPLDFAFTVFRSCTHS